MGFRGRVRTVNHIEYGSGLGNHLFNEFEDFFYSCKNLFPDLHITELDSTTWEFSKVNFSLLIDRLKKLPSKAKEKLGADIHKQYKDQFKSCLEGFNYALECCETWLAESDPNDEWLTIDWY